MKSKKLVSLGLALCMLMCLSVPAFATETENKITSSGGTATTPVTVTAEATTFSVTVPTSIPIAVGTDGTVTVASVSAVKITNNSAGPVYVSSITMQDSSWTLVDYNGGDRSDMAKAGVDAKKLGFQLAVGTGDTEDKAATEDTSYTSAVALKMDQSKWVVNGSGSGNNELSVTCSAIATAVSTAISASDNITAANVVFTIGWKTATTNFTNTHPTETSQD
jgi:hypothetical protein